LSGIADDPGAGLCLSFFISRNGQKEALKFFEISAFLMFGNVLFNLERAGTDAIGRVR
jgi:hypothetical protein